MKIIKFSEVNESNKYGIDKKEIDNLVKEFINLSEKSFELEEKIADILNPVVDQMIKQEKFEEAKKFLNTMWGKAEEYQTAKDTKIAQINALMKK